MLKYGRDTIEQPITNQERRLSWIAKQGGVCAICGNLDWLEVDHIDPRLKTMQPPKIFARSTPAQAREQELSNCQVLCKPCHLKKTGEDASVYRVGVKLNVRTRTHCPHGHAYDLENTYVTPGGAKVCRKCRRKHQSK